MLPFLRLHFGNPSSSHVYGRRAHDAVERARLQVAILLGCDPDEVIFTSGGTEANNLAIHGVAEACAERRRIITTAIEHPATSGPCTWLAAQGHAVLRLGVDAMGRVQPEDARAALDGDTALVTVMHSNNETGVLQPIRELVELARGVGTMVHTDAAQSVGRVRVDVRALGVDLLSLAGHKLYAPKGVGALYAKRGTPLVPFLRGAGHEQARRPGTENVAAIVGLGVACERAGQDLEVTAQRQRQLRDLLWQRLAAGIPQLALNGHPELRLPNTLSVRFPQMSGNVVLAGAAEIAASTGSACHAGCEAASSVILAMGVAPEAALGTVRLTLGRGTTESEVTRAADALVRSWSRALVEPARA